jgi:UDPglucose 6-dehydrogenase
MEKENSIAIIGLWHLGIVTAACLASYNNKVTAIDPNSKTITNLKKGNLPVYEPGLAELVKEQYEKGTLSFTTDFRSGLNDSKYIIIAFDTPMNDDDSPDLSPILQSVSESISYLQDGSLLIISSQVPLGTCEQIELLIKKRRPSLIFGIVCMPENLKLGIAISRFKSPDFLLIGANKEEDFKNVEKLYGFVTSPKIKVDLRTAEMVKHAINAFTACEVSFANELGNICDKFGVDEFRVAEILHLDPKVGKQAPLRAGLGFSGGTLGRDVNVLRALGKKEGTKTTLLDAIMSVNYYQNQTITNNLRIIFGRIKGLHIGVLGLTYKAGTSTLRRSASIEIIKELIQKGASIKAYDPKADLVTKIANGSFERCSDADSVFDSSDVLLILTGWPEFKELNFVKLKPKMSHSIIIDASNILDGDLMTKHGFIYVGMGRGHQAKAINDVKHQNVSK